MVMRTNGTSLHCQPPPKRQYWVWPVLLGIWGAGGFRGHLMTKRAQAFQLLRCSRLGVDPTESAFTVDVHDDEEPEDVPLCGGTLRSVIVVPLSMLRVRHHHN